MRAFISVLYKILRRVWRNWAAVFDWLQCRVVFYLENVSCRSFKTNGTPFVSVARGGVCLIGNGLSINNGLKGNPIGRPQPCIFFVGQGAFLEIGENVGLSSVALVAHKKIYIGNDVKIGGGVCIYDTDFHALDPVLRGSRVTDRSNAAVSDVFISDNVFIGAHSTILKGVSIGNNSIIGACSVVTKSVPANEIWAGNPAKFIRRLSGG